MLDLSFIAKLSAAECAAVAMALAARLAQLAEPAPPAPPPLSSVEVVAPDVRLPVAGIYAMARWKVIPSKRIGRSVRFDLQPVRRALAA